MKRKFISMEHVLLRWLKAGASKKACRVHNDAEAHPRPKYRGGAFKFATGVGAFVALLASNAAADPCPTNLVNPIYGAGGSAVTATLGAVATALAGLPASSRVTIFYWDPGACVGYESFIGKAGSAQPAYFKFWNAQGELTQCEPNGDEELSFAHMGNTPALCPADEPLPSGFGRFVAPVQTINFITHKDSEYDAISAEALYHVYGFGPGATGRRVVPWVNENGIYARPTNAFVHQVISRIIGVPSTAFKVPAENFLSTNPLEVDAVFQWGESSNPNQPLGYVSGSAADLGESNNQIKTLAFQAYDQTCAVLPDSSRTSKDKANVRSGQYAIWTPAWFYAAVNSSGNVRNSEVEKLIGWFDGTLQAPGGIDIVEIVIQSGDIPICAMQSIRPQGDLSDVVSFAPDDPCGGYFEYVATGSTSHAACDDHSDCDEEAEEQCRYGFCEPY